MDQSENLQDKKGKTEGTYGPTNQHPDHSEPPIPPASMGSQSPPSPPRDQETNGKQKKITDNIKLGLQVFGLVVLITYTAFAITLSLCHQDVLGERLGRNVRYGGIGVAAGSLLLGLVGNFISDSAVFLVAGALGVPALLALRGIAAADLASAHERTGHHTAPPPRKRRSPQQPVRRLLRDRRLVALLLCVFLFQLGNAELLPLVASEFAGKAGSHADLLAAAASIVPQLLAALLSPRVAPPRSTVGAASWRPWA